VHVLIFDIWMTVLNYNTNPTVIILVGIGTVAETFRNFGGASAEGTSFLGGSGGMPPQKIFKIWTPEMAFAAF
jgi:hypothetical protein